MDDKIFLVYKNFTGPNITEFTWYFITVMIVVVVKKKNDMEPLISNNYAILKKTFYGASINFTDEGLYVIYIFNGFFIK